MNDNDLAWGLSGYSMHEGDIRELCAAMVFSDDEDDFCKCACEGCNYSGHCGVNYTGCGAT